MATAKLSRRRTSLVDPYLPAIFRANRPSSPAPASTWQRSVDGDAAAFDELLNFYAPWVTFYAATAKSRRPEFYIDPLEDLISDGAIGLMNLLHSAAGLASVGLGLKRHLRTAMYRGCAERNWGGIRPSARSSAIRQERSRLVDELGRMPSPDELHASLRQKLTNGQIQIGDNPTFASFSALESAGGKVREFSDPQAPPPFNRLMRRELMRVARRSLSGDDLGIFRMAVEGESQADIGRRFGFSRERARQRVNGIFWQLRQRTDLAKYLDVESAEQTAAISSASSRMRRVG